MTAMAKYERLARLCGLVAMLIGISGLLGWSFNLPVLHSIVPGYKPIAISASMLFLFLGGFQLISTRRSLTRITAGILLAFTLFIILVALLEIIDLLFGTRLSIEDAILRQYPVIYQNPDALISPVASVLVLLLGLGQALLLAQRLTGRAARAIADAVGMLGTLAILVSIVFFLGYLYRAPLLVGTRYLPIAWLATTAAIMLGIGLMALAGEKALPLRVFTGPSTRARLLRAFLPLTALVLVLSNVTLYLLSFYTRVNPALAAGAVTALFLLIATSVILQVARVFGGIIDRAETERAEATEELRQREAQLTTIIENMTEGLVVSTVEGELIQWNRTALAMHGFASLGEVRRWLPEFTAIFELATLDGTVLPLEQWPLARILRGENLRDWDLRVRHLQEGWVRIFSYGGTLVRDEYGASIMAVVTITDITARKQVEAEREQLLREVREWAETLELRVQERTAALTLANKELEAFSYSVSHDLRAPLRSIDGFSKILLERYSPALDERGQDYLHRVRAAAQRMGQLIDDMLGLSRIGRAEMRREPVALSALAAEIMGELREREPERTVEAVIQPDIVAVGDPELLRIVLTNLLGNAWKFSREREIARIEFGVMERDHQQVYYIRDNGAGFDMTYVDKLFSPFQRLHTEVEFSGTGIGLAIVQRIVHRHGGTAWAESIVGQGATFYFTLTPEGGTNHGDAGDSPGRG
jgi:signal transduction histidine kinase